ncbi:NCS1 family nucleobase:cation symporter-1 [Clostridium sp. DJ247]|uniref:NCS1 family nucleobase:cation symporter-1 n=1 Tax=Clostridium sp. DJ247 TaxID=2726188 RepID=UPI00162743AE|nr:NCS1 family nucleobase:cation symporter-1 [Clostridium sp. DJ247]MBC2582368.1 NCS1 family nucleobase:cation symporter-1 [Clostridium sp. DJ247]
MSRIYKTQKEIGGLYELTDTAVEEVKSSPYYNDDLAATKIKQRTWGTYNIAALWIGMSVCIPTYMMASSMIDAGLTWWQALINIGLANLIVLIPMQLNSHAGTKYGIPYPVFARLSFGIKGSNIAAMARAIIGAGWFGINVWIGGQSINAVMATISPAWANWGGGIWISFFVFLFLNVFIAYKGPEAIKFMEAWAAPILGVISIALMIWAYSSVAALGKGISDILSIAPNSDKSVSFWKVFLAGLTANIAFWSTLSLNIPDFSRFAKSQKAQFRGQLLGLPLTMIAFAFVGVFVTGATKIIYGEFLWNPVDVISKMNSPIAAILGAIGIIIATLTTNISANAVATANDISNLNPQKISFKTATLITGAAAVAIMPWKLMSSASAYIFDWLGTYGLLLGPLAGIYIADYYIHRKKLVDVFSLFKGDGGKYWYKNGFNKNAIYAWILAAILPLAGKFIPALSSLTDNGWAIGFILAMIIYTLLMKNDKESILTEKENNEITESEIISEKVV